MIGVPVNANSVHVPLVQTGCSQAEFDSTYPIHLSGIIREDEFQESIRKINKAFSASKTLITACWVTFTLTITVGTIAFLIAGLMASRSMTVFYVCLAVGIVLTTFGSLFLSIGFCVIFSRRGVRLRQAVAEESKIYSSRSPVPCSWRLDMSRAWFGGYGSYQNNQLAYNLVIDIGHSISTTNDARTHFFNHVAPAPTSLFGQENNYPPPPYFGQSAGFCSQCSTPRPNLSARFCSSCGHPFNKY